MNILLIKLKDGLTIVGEKVSEKNPYITLTQVLLMRHLANFRKLEDGLLEEMTEADTMNDNLSQRSLRSIPMMNIPDESIFTSNSIEEALSKNWPLNKDQIITHLIVDEKSLVGKFYKGTLKLMMTDRSLAAKLFSVCDVDVKVLDGIYNDEKTSKYFSIKG